MKENKEQNAVIALLTQYQKAVLELQTVIENVSTLELTTIVDHSTENPDCKSIQTILTHEISSGYSYCVYVQNLKDKSVKRPERIIRQSAEEYKQALDDVLKFTLETFSNIQDKELEEFNEVKKIKTSWGQLYDIEQIMEHAIVHILRHIRQIEKFKSSVRS